MDVHEQQHLRQDKDELFRHDHHSPIPADQWSSFNGLRYVPPAPELVFDLPVEPADGSTLEIPTSDGWRRRCRRSGRVRFAVDGEGAELVLLARDDEEGFSLPFRDATSRRDAHGAGRYLDVAPAQDGRVYVHSNLAYNPYWAYDDAFSCPLPPAESWLRVPLRASEAVYAP